MTTNPDAPTVNRSVMSKDLIGRIQAHLETAIGAVVEITPRGKGSVVVRFAEPVTTYPMDAKFAPLLLNWSMTQSTADGAIYLNVPAAWRQEGEGMKPLTPHMKDLLAALLAGASANEVTKTAYFSEGSGRDAIGFAANSLTALKVRGLVEADLPNPPGWWRISEQGKQISPSVLSIEQLATALATEPIPVNELENADEPCGDVGTLTDPEPANNLPDVQQPEPEQPADPTAWATDAKRAEVSAFLEAKNFYPAELKPTSTEGVWLVEDYRRAEKFKARLEKIGVEIVGKVLSDWMGDEPYAVAEIRLPEGAMETVSEDYRPFPSGRRTKPAPIPNSLYAQYDQLHETLPAATLLLIQANAENWNAYTIDAALLRRYAPLCRFGARIVNERGEKWDVLTVPAGVVDELLDLAKEGGLTVALAPIVRDEPPALPAREVTEIHAPGEPVQYVGKEETPEVDDEPEPVAPAVTPELDMTPERVAAKIRLHIAGGLRLGRVCAVTPDRLLDGTFTIRFMHPVNEFVLKALRAEYDEAHAVDGDRFCVSLRPKPSAAAHGDVLDQAAVVIAQTPALPDAPVLLSEINELQLMDELRFDHPALYEAAPGVVSFLLNVIAALRAERLANAVE